MHIKQRFNLLGTCLQRLWDQVRIVVACSAYGLLFCPPNYSLSDINCFTCSGPADQMFRGSVTPGQPQQHSAIEGPLRTASDTGSDHDD